MDLFKQTQKKHRRNSDPLDHLCAKTYVSTNGHAANWHNAKAEFQVGRNLKAWFAVFQGLK